MKCINCDNEGNLKDKFEVLSEKSSKSNYDDWDQIIKLKCKKCGKVFEHID